LLTVGATHQLPARPGAQRLSWARAILQPLRSWSRIRPACS